jgi:protein-disulfide isomerase
MKLFLKSAIVLLGLVAGSVIAATTSADVSLSKFSKVQQKQLNSYIDQRIHDYILSNPKVIIESVQKMQQQAEEKKVGAGKKAAIEYAAKLVSTHGSPAVGPKNAPVTVVEFFDYQCSACHALYPQIKIIMKKNPNIRYVYKEFPIFGAASEFAAKAAIAAQKQGKFAALHDALFTSNKLEGKLKKEDVLAMAKKVGINIPKLEKDMQDPAIAQEIKANYDLAAKLKLPGTPALVVIPTPPKGKELSAADFSNRFGFFPGAAPANKIQAMIDKAAGK